MAPSISCSHALRLGCSGSSRRVPGVTGLATLAFHRTEERLLAPCRNADQTEAVYCRRCVPRKARLDLIYARRRSLCYDLRLIAATVIRRIPLN